METFRILHLEDNLVDAELVEATLADCGLPCDVTRVDSKSDFENAVARGSFDIILSDFNLPGFDGKTALAIAQRTCPDTPFVFVSGTIGEDAAIESLTSGATDYVLKHKFSRLVPAIQRAKRDAEERLLRKEAEQTIRESEEKYRRLFEESKDAILIISAEGQFLDINAAGVELLGCDSKVELHNVDFVSQFYCDPEKGAELQRIISHNGFVRDYELKLKRKDGNPIVVLATATPLRDTQGRLAGYRGIYRDVTEQRRLEAQFLRAQRLDCIGTLASGIAHDLNNILSPILMAIQLLRDQSSNDKDDRLLNALEGSALRGRDLVKQVLTFARGNEGQRGPIPLRHLVRDVETIITETFPKAIRIMTEVPNDLWSVHGDITQLHQVLMNLCVNARDAMPSGGLLKVAVANVTVTAEEGQRTKCPAGAYVAIKVSDSGEGIPAAVLDKIFEAFFTTKEPGKGTGLGLSTVQTLVRGHGGAIDVTSKVGHGATFTVFMPATERVSKTSAAPKAQTIKNGNGQLLLFVDDERAIRDVSRIILEAYGYRVLLASDGTEGLKTFAQHGDEIRLVLTDVNMPGMDGAQMAGEIQRLRGNVPIVFITGVSDPLDAVGELEGKARFLTKPFTAETLLHALDDALGDPASALAASAGGTYAV